MKEEKKSQFTSILNKNQIPRGRIRHSGESSVLNLRMVRLIYELKNKYVNDKKIIKTSCEKCIIY